MHSGVLLAALVAGVLFVNGFTDAPNAITGVVCAGVLRFRTAALLAAGCNVAGLLAAWRFAPRVAGTIRGLAVFSGASARAASAALTAALLAVVVFAVAAWAFGIPTSESHALAAALTGAAIAAGGSVIPRAWGNVLWGLAFSSAGGFAAGWVLCSLMPGGGRRAGWGARAQVACTALMALLHGAQDGLKFVGVLQIARDPGGGLSGTGPAAPGALGDALLCAAVMSLGTLCGGRRIVEAVGGRMVALDGRTGAASDLAAAALLAAATALGVPMSTTHTKTCAVLGAGAAAGGGVDRGAARAMALAWGVTFPACFAVGWLVTAALR